MGANPDILSDAYAARSLQRHTQSLAARQNHGEDLKNSIQRPAKEILLHSSNSLAVSPRSNKHSFTAPKGSCSSTSGRSICTPNSSSRTARRFTIRSESQPGIASNVLAVLISSRVALGNADEKQRIK